MNLYQKELARMLELFSLSSPQFGENNPNLLPANYSNGNHPNDPETDRLSECFAYMMSQSNVKFIENSNILAINDLSSFLAEWFEPAVSSTILKAKITDWEQWNQYNFPEETLISFTSNNTNKEISFSNDLPISILPLEISESYFAYDKNDYCAILKLKSLSDIKNLGKVKIFIDYSKFSHFYRLLDEIFFTKKKIIINNNGKEYSTESERKNISYSFVDIFDLSIYNESNYTYYLYQFINYLNNYCFFDFDFSKFKIDLKKDDEIKITIPLGEYIQDSSDVTNYAHTNCFAAKNKNTQRGDPIYLKKGQKPYLTLDRASKKNFIGIKNILFYDLEHKDLPLTLNKDYRIYKKFISFSKGLDIVYYLKIIKPLDRDIIILPYFHYSDLTNAHSVPVNSELKLKRNSKYKFENMAVPSKTIFYLENFKDNKFYRSIFLMNANLMQENLNIQDIFNTLKCFSVISLGYKGIMLKVINQLKIVNEINDKTQIHNAYGCFHQKRYKVTLEINKQTYQFGGVSVLIHFLETLLNKVSKINSQYKIDLKVI